MSVNGYHSRQYHIVVPCLDEQEQTKQVPAGEVIGHYHAMEEEDVTFALSSVDEVGAPVGHRRPSEPGEVPTHVEQLLQQAKNKYKDTTEVEEMKKILQKNENVFSNGEEDQGLTNQWNMTCPGSQTAAVDDHF